jgi:hypothetical protein
LSSPQDLLSEEFGFSVLVVCVDLVLVVVDAKVLVMVLDPERDVPLVMLHVELGVVLMVLMCQIHWSRMQQAVSTRH